MSSQLADGTDQRATVAQRGTVRYTFLSSILVTLLFLVSVSADRNGSHVIRLGFLGATNLPNANTQAGTGPALFAARLALAQFKQQTGLLPDTDIVLINNNTNSDAGTGNYMAYDQILNRGIVGIIGEYNSGVSQTIAYPSRFYRIPMVSYGSTSPDFTTFHDTQYPYFLRMCPSQNLESVLLAYVINYYGWNRVGLIYTTDSPGTAGAQAFQAIATTLGIQVVTSQSFALGGASSDVYYAMNNIKTSGATILLFIGAISDFQTIMKVCLNGDSGKPALGLYGAGYQWLGLHSYMYTTVFQNSTGGVLPAQLQFVQGMMGLQNFADASSQIYKDYATAWSQFPKQPDLPSVDPSNPLSITAPANFGYDAFWFYIRALHRMQYEFGIDMNTASMSDRALFLAVLKNVTFAGVSGPVAVDQKGDRSAPFNIMNFQGQTIVSIGTVTSAGQVTMFDGVTTQFMGGYKALDHVVRGTYIIDLPTRTGLNVVTAIMMGVIAVFMIMVFALRERAVMKAASPPFLCLMLLGVLSLLSALFPRISENSSPSLGGCKADLFLTNFGYVLMVGSLLVKTYRVDSIFRMKQFQQRVLTDAHLLGGLGLLLIFQTAILLGLIYGQPLYMKLDSYDSTSDYSYCGSDAEKTYLIVIMVYRFFLLAITAIYSFRIRDIPDAFNESKTIAATVYNLTFLSILLPIIDTAMGRGKGSAVVAYSISIFVIALATSCIMLLPKIFLIFVQHVSAVRGDKAHTQVSQPSGADSTPVKKDTSLMMTGTLTKQRSSAVEKSPVPMPRTTVGNANRARLTPGGAKGSAAPSPSDSGLIQSPSQPTSILTSNPTPGSPRMHLSRNLSATLMQMIAQQLDNNGSGAAAASGSTPMPGDSRAASPTEVTISVQDLPATPDESRA